MFLYIWRGCGEGPSSNVKRSWEREGREDKVRIEAKEKIRREARRECHSKCQIQIRNEQVWQGGEG